jgi:hypothetical protein
LMDVVCAGGPASAGVAVSALDAASTAAGAAADLVTLVRRWAAGAALIDWAFTVTPMIGADALQRARC